MNEIEFNITTNQNITTTSLGLVHHQTKLDVFIIKAFSLLTNRAIIDSNGFNSTVNSPQTTIPPSTTASNSKSGTPNGSNSNVNTPSQGKLDSIDQPGDLTSTNASQIVKSEIQEQASQQNNIFTTRGQFIPIFQKVSAVYNATLTNIPIDEKSTSPKSAIELFQRLHQIIRELSLSYSSSPYAGYFDSLKDNMWQIKSDSELATDQLWQLVTTSILTVFNPETGNMINQNIRNKRINSSNSSPNNSGSNTEGATGNNTAETTPTSLTNSTNSTVTANSGNNAGQAPKRVKKKYVRKKNVTTKKIQNTKSTNVQGTCNSTSVVPDFSLNQEDPSTNNINGQQQLTQQQPFNMNIDASLPHILQKRLQNVSQDVNSRSLAGYYTQPTSPGSDVNNFEFSLAPNDFNSTDYNAALQNATINSNGNINTEATNLIGNNGSVNMNNNSLNSSIWKRRSMGALDGTVMDGEDAVDDILQFSNTLKNKNNRGGITVMDNTLSNRGTDVQISMENSIQSNDAKNEHDMMLVDHISKLLKQSYDSLLNEKDQRISQLERELELQRNETQWLRKMLIEDMGCVRSLLSNTRK
ncbi:similar to Saccharomyces cerevisiae YNL199C GCR2 Transcriptional activator of genes involved in glycolysis [Maudiozyma saulgeensis]|uniref:Similar to Saccharomyces cerevisiae YNL199C GCR2 Transcriptional activator of genes involved in glycolysis n=1 Tax=Maudiozyma saulgeensis TaxID=1789683 RepID=A0A1X7R2V5_9SACH|nr:similar to Saccharomyces cerevisiae YNL199C GCR2 Transcriptional activator of genes involved in glycolysis [Kazachstania saulgeensis]